MNNKDKTQLNRKTRYNLDRINRTKIYYLKKIQKQNTRQGDGKKTILGMAKGA